MLTEQIKDNNMTFSFCFVLQPCNKFHPSVAYDRDFLPYSCNVLRKSSVDGRLKKIMLTSSSNTYEIHALLVVVNSNIIRYGITKQLC